MRVALGLIGAFLMLSGVIWFFQGIGVLPGSFMTGQIQWAYYGGVAVIVGAALLVVANRSRRRSQS